MKAILKLYSVCDCGFPLMKVDIPTGTEYEVDPTNQKEFDFRCGGCHRWQRLMMIWVEGRGLSRAGYLPTNAFDLGGEQRNVGALNRFGPGVWADSSGTLHLDLPELLRHLKLENTKTNRDMVSRVAHEVFREQWPNTPIIETKDPDA